MDLLRSRVMWWTTSFANDVVDPTGVEPVSTGVKSIEVAVTSTGPGDPGQTKDSQHKFS